MEHPRFEGIKIVIDEHMPPGSVLLVPRETAKEWNGRNEPLIFVDAMKTLETAIDDDFMKRCGIISGLAIPK